MFNIAVETKDIWDEALFVEFKPENIRDYHSISVESCRQVDQKAVPCEPEDAEFWSVYALKRGTDIYECFTNCPNQQIAEMVQAYFAMLAVGERLQLVLEEAA